MMKRLGVQGVVGICFVSLTSSCLVGGTDQQGSTTLTGITQLVSSGTQPSATPTPTSSSNYPVSFNTQSSTMNIAVGLMSQNTYVISNNSPNDVSGCTLTSSDPNGVIVIDSQSCGTIAARTGYCTFTVDALALNPGSFTSNLGLNCAVGGIMGAKLAVTANATGNPTGLTGGYIFTPDAGHPYLFSPIPVGQSSASGGITITNGFNQYASGCVLSLSQSMSGFTLSNPNECATMAPNSSCTVDVNFTPTTPATAYSANVYINCNFPSVNLTGLTGVLSVTGSSAAASSAPASTTTSTTTPPISSVGARGIVNAGAGYIPVATSTCSDIHTNYGSYWTSASQIVTIQTVVTCTDATYYVVAGAHSTFTVRSDNFADND